MLKIGQRLYNLTPDQADALIGAEVEFLNENSDEYERGIVTSVTKDCHDDTHAVYIANGERIWLGCNDGFSIKILNLPRTARHQPAPASETLDARIKRLRAELAEAEAEAREGAPKGWRWTSGVRLEQIEGGESVRLLPITGYVCYADAYGDETAIDFDAIAALVDRVRRDRGEAPAPTSAPVSAPRGASSVAIPDGWEVGEYVDGPVMHSDDYNVYITYTDHPNGSYLTICDDGERVVIPINAMRAYLALCDM